MYIVDFLDIFFVMTAVSFFVAVGKQQQGKRLKFFLFKN